MPSRDVYVPSSMELLSHPTLQLETIDEAAVTALTDYACFLQEEAPDKPADDIMQLVSWACAISKPRSTLASILQGDSKHRVLLEAAIRHVAVGDFHDLAAFTLLHHAAGMAPTI